MRNGGRRFALRNAFIIKKRKLPCRCHTLIRPPRLAPFGGHLPPLRGKACKEVRRQQAKGFPLNGGSCHVVTDEGVVPCDKLFLLLLPVISTKRRNAAHGEIPFYKAKRNRNRHVQKEGIFRLRGASPRVSTAARSDRRLGHRPRALLCVDSSRKTQTVYYTVCRMFSSSLKMTAEEEVAVVGRDDRGGRETRKKEFRRGETPSFITHYAFLIEKAFRHANAFSSILFEVQAVFERLADALGHLIISVRIRIESDSV